jgi:lactate dehydrogenase-like 2-hydroxyacid dehydrogenase
MPKKILALGSLLPAEMHNLGAHFDVIKLWAERDPEETLKQNKDNIVGIVSTYNGIQVTKRLIESLPNVSIVSQFGAGIDNIDVEALRAREIILTNTPDILTDDTADLAMALTLSVMRRVVEADMYVRVGKWHSGAFPLSTSLSGKTMGIVGMGRIGQAIARRASAFNMEVIYNGRTEKSELDYKFYADLVQMAEISDVLMISCVGGMETRHLINARVLKALGNKGFLVNIARGSVVKTEDLLVALSNRFIAGAALDVYETEPHIPEALLNMDQVVILPHIGSATQDTRSKMGRMVIENIISHFEGKVPPNLFKL